MGHHLEEQSQFHNAVEGTRHSSRGHQARRILKAFLSRLTPSSAPQGSEPNAGGWEWSNTDVLNYFAWERSPATVSNPGHCGILSRTSGKKQRRSHLLSLSLSSPISGLDRQRILLCYEVQYWFVCSHPLSSLFLSSSL